MFYLPIESYANESELHFELYRHLKNWVEGLYGEECYSEITVKPELSKPPVFSEINRYVSTDLAFLHEDNVYLTMEIKHEGSSSQGATHVETVTQAFKQGFYLFTIYVSTFTENEFCLFEYVGNVELGEAAIEGKWLTPQNIQDVLLERFEVNDLKTSAKHILDIVRKAYRK